MAEAVPDRVAAAGSETAMLVTYGGAYPDTGELFSNLILEGQGWGGKEAGDGFDVVTVPNSNCVVTPIEVYETRYPLLHHSFELNENSAGAGRSRGGLGSIRVLELRSPMTFSTERRRTGFSPGYCLGKMLYSQKLQRNGQPRREIT